MENFTPNQNQTPNTPNPSPSVETVPASKTSNTLIGSIVLIIILLLGGLLIWAKQDQKMTAEKTAETANATPSEQPENIEGASSAEVSANDDLDSLENEVNSTQIESSENFDYSFDQN